MLRANNGSIRWTGLIVLMFQCLTSGAQVTPAAERMHTWQHLLCDHQVGLVLNQTSMVGKVHLVDTLVAKDYCVARIFAPEHGFRGGVDAGEKVKDGMDEKTGIPITSLYGNAVKPAAADMEALDLVVFDIQDVGARFYTYISTLFYVMEACAEYGKPLIVLDRPNPNGHYIDGPILDMRVCSFVGVAPLPIVHGCTVGEIALMFKGEYWCSGADKLDLTVIPCANYTHATPYELPVRPSPNLPTARSILLYPSLCLFEGTVASVGRGTDSPFEMVGHPDMPPRDTADHFQFTPKSNFGNKRPLYENTVCRGMDFRQVSLDMLRQHKQIELDYLLDFYQAFPKKDEFFLKNNFFNLLSGTLSLRKQIVDGCNADEIRESWQADLNAYRAIRACYLLYPEK
ncbi:MAG: DUF1343 domain-containing protein [Saprospiraceae bacterium]|nr:DUF1343 domain-containing protein [Saprospiraceae bacterium]